MITPYTEGPLDQAWEVEPDDSEFVIQRRGCDERAKASGYKMPYEQHFRAFDRAQAEALTARLNELDRLREQRQIFRDQVMDILQRANAGWLNDYKTEINGSSYIQWGKVEDDIRALFAAPDAKADLVQQVQAWRSVGRYILNQWGNPETMPPPALIRLLVKRTQAAMDGTTEEGSL